MRKTSSVVRTTLIMVARMAHALPEPISALPPALIAAVENEAHFTANLVGCFLRVIGFAAGPGHPIHLPPAFLLELGAALRLTGWDRAGARAHLVHGPPPGLAALNEVFGRWGLRPRSGDRPADGDRPIIAAGVLAVAVERFAWAGRPMFGADVELDDLDGDAAVEALAECLLVHATRFGTLSPAAPTP